MVTIIIGYLEDEVAALKACIRTSKDWYLIARPLHYRALKLQSMHQYHNSLQSPRDSPEIRSWVQKACFDDSKYDVVTTVGSRGLDALLDQLFKIRTLEFRALRSGSLFSSVLTDCRRLQTTSICVLRLSRCQLSITLIFPEVIQELKQLSSLQLLDTVTHSWYDYNRD